MTGGGGDREAELRGLRGREGVTRRKKLGGGWGGDPGRMGWEFGAIRWEEMETSRRTGFLEESRVWG